MPKSGKWYNIHIWNPIITIVLFSLRTQGSTKIHHSIQNSLTLQQCKYEIHQNALLAWLPDPVCRLCIRKYYILTSKFLTIQILSSAPVINWQIFKKYKRFIYIIHLGKYLTCQHFL